MGRINANIQALLATRILNRQHASPSRVRDRLSTGLRINSGKDGPAGPIASETLRGEMKTIAVAIENARAAENMVAVAEAALQAVGSWVSQIVGLACETAGEAALSDDEVRANQLRIDAILESIDRAANAALFNDPKLLDGTFDHVVSGQASRLVGVQVDAAIDTASLGDARVGYLSSLKSGGANDLGSGNFATAREILNTATRQVATARSMLGSFRNYRLQTTVNSLRVASENVASAQSAVRDTDFAVEAAGLTRAQILLSVATAALQVASAAPQSVLTLLA